MHARARTHAHTHTHNAIQNTSTQQILKEYIQNNIDTAKSICLKCVRDRHGFIINGFIIQVLVLRSLNIGTKKVRIFIHQLASRYMTLLSSLVSLAHFLCWQPLCNFLVDLSVVPSQLTNLVKLLYITNCILIGRNT